MQEFIKATIFGSNKKAYINVDSINAIYESGRNTFYVDVGNETFEVNENVMEIYEKWHKLELCGESCFINEI